MIVSQAHKFVFVHIPKNAGTTVETVLMPHLVEDVDLHVSILAKIPENRAAAKVREDARLDKHVTARQLRYAMEPGAYDQLFSFAFSRNPYSRCYSAYNFLVRRAGAEMRKMAKGLPASAGPERSMFLEATFDDICDDLDSVTAAFNLFRPQTDWLPLADSVDFVGRLENLTEDLRLIHLHLGLPLTELDDAPTENMKAVKGAWRNMSAKSAAAIRAFYASDFDRFGYNPDFNADDSAPARTPIERREIRGAAVPVLPNQTPAHNPDPTPADLG